jgi:hypothetical protein
MSSSKMGGNSRATGSMGGKVMGSSKVPEINAGDYGSNPSLGPGPWQPQKSSPTEYGLAGPSQRGVHYPAWPLFGFQQKDVKG